ncbi:MAG: hypothetical protein ACYTF6_09845 [Planctomycetota bacterium]|jgi:hypothetical protein
MDRQAHHLLAVEIWNTVFKSRLPRGGARMSGFTKTVQEVFWNSIEEVARHGHHPALTDMEEILLRRHVEKFAGSLDKIGYYTTRDARDFVRLLKELPEKGGASRAWRRAFGTSKKALALGDDVGHALRAFRSAGRWSRRTAYRQAYEYIARAVGGLRESPQFADHATKVLSKSRKLLRTIRRLAGEGKALSADAMEKLGRGSGRKVTKLIWIVGAAVSVWAVSRARGELKRKEDEIAKLAEELRNTPAADYAEKLRMLQRLEEEQIDLEEWLNVEVAEAFIPIPFVPTACKLLGSWNKSQMEAIMAYKEEVTDFRDMAQQEAYQIYLEAIGALERHYWAKRSANIRKWLEPEIKRLQRLLTLRYGEAAKKDGVRFQEKGWSPRFYATWTYYADDFEWTKVGDFKLLLCDDTNNKCGKWAAYGVKGTNGFEVIILFTEWQVLGDQSGDKFTLEAFADAIKYDEKSERHYVEDLDLSGSERYKSAPALTESFRWLPRCVPSSRSFRVAPFVMSTDRNPDGPFKALNEEYKKHLRYWEDWWLLQLYWWNEDHTFKTFGFSKDQKKRIKDLLKRMEK